MSPSLKAALATYRICSAAAFAKTKQASPEPPPTSHPSQPYTPSEVPGLHDYLARAHIAFHSRHPTPSATPPSQRLSRPLGSAASSTQERAYIASRRARYQAHLALRAASARAPAGAACCTERDAGVRCGIPDDVRRRARKRFLERRAEERRVGVGFVWGVLGGRRLGRAEEGVEGLRRGDFVDGCGLLEYLERCRQVGLEGGRVLYGRCGRGVVHVDCAEEVRRRYAGKPDERYRRRMGRRYASWRRVREEREREMERREMVAEMEMKRRRGYDQLLTGRVEGDASCVPFLYELRSCAYAFSSKISEAPKLRKVMVDKYSKLEGTREKGVDGWEQARLVAENNPMFHTKVMNRFL